MNENLNSENLEKKEYKESPKTSRFIGKKQAVMYWIIAAVSVGILILVYNFVY